MSDPTEARAALENDLRELWDAKPGELAKRLIERGWALVALPDDGREGLHPDEVRRALLRYGAHHQGVCRATILGHDPRCTCGLSAALTDKP